MGISNHIFLVPRADEELGGGGEGELWIWQDLSQHTNQEGEDMTWQGDGIPAIPGELNILFEDGDSLLFEDGDNIWWEE